jgi:hypothetical protein
MEDEKTVAVDDEDNLPDDSVLFTGWEDEPDESDKPDEAVKADPPKTEQKETKPAETAKIDVKTDDVQLDSYTLKHLDEVKSVDRNEVIVLAQKGLDYDRQKGKNTELTQKIEELTQLNDQYSEAYTFLKELADQQSFSVEQLIDDTRAAVLADRQKIEKEVALERVKNRRESTVKEKPKPTPSEAKAPEKTAEQAAEERRQTEIKEFLAEYPSVDPKAIAKEVWKGVAAGKSLLLSYKSWENSQLKAQLEVEQKNNENKAKSTGSRATAGNKPPEDKWFVGWVD